MLRRLLDSIRAKRGVRQSVRILGAAFESWTAGDQSSALSTLEMLLERSPGSAHVHYWYGAMLLAHGTATQARDAFDRALSLEPDRVAYMVGLADANLARGDDESAFMLYCQALPGIAECDQAADDAGWPYRHAHPVWLQQIPRLLLSGEPMLAQPPFNPPSNADIRKAPTALINFAALLMRKALASRAVPLLEQALVVDPRCGPAAAALALFFCLNHDWDRAISAARAAKLANTSVWRECNDACLLAGGIETGRLPGDLDEFADWSALRDDGAALAGQLKTLPEVAWPANPSASTFTLFVACDETYFHQYTVALVLSANAAMPGIAVHLHLFCAADRLGLEIERLASAASATTISISHETVDFARHGGTSIYCQTMRFARLHQWMAKNPGLVVMLDADSLIRRDLRPRLSAVADAALIEAPGEPPWHRHPAGLTVFRPTQGGKRLLRRMAAVMASNAIGAAIPYGLDQVTLYVLARRAAGTGEVSVDTLDGNLCDTQFNPISAVWSITQDKTRDSPFALESRALLAANGWPEIDP